MTMDHKTLKQQLFALYDGELAGESRLEVESHLAGCAECQRLYGQWSKTAKVFFKVPEPATSEFFVRSVMNRIQALETPKPAIRWEFSFRWFATAVGLAALLLVLMPQAPQALSMDMLFQDNSAASSLLLSNKAMTSDDTLQFLMEGQQ